jgi:hypothetical protein
VVAVRRGDVDARAFAVALGSSSKQVAKLGHHGGIDFPHLGCQCIALRFDLFEVRLPSREILRSLYDLEPCL